MTGKPTGNLEVRPNTLRDQMAPNTFRAATPPRRPDRSQAPTGPGSGRQRLRPMAVQTPRWVYVALGVVAIVIALFLLQGMP